MIPYYVNDLEEGLILHPTFPVKEPNPHHCTVASAAEVACVLVPGLGFDKDGHRIGYGMGHYDQFLKELKCPVVGIAFKEQLVEGGIPTEDHDVAVQEAWFF